MLPIFFTVITIAALLLLYMGIGKKAIVLVAGFVWLAVTSILAWGGFFTNTAAMPPRFLLVPVIVTAGCIWLYKSNRSIVVKQNYLLALHCLRLPVELVLYNLYLQKKIPVIMTFEGWNFDIVTGVTALLLLMYTLITGKVINRRLLLLWNAGGLLLLITIVLIAVLSAPFPFQQLAFKQPNIAVLQFPYVWLPAVVVPAVLLSHLFLFKKPAVAKVNYNL